MTNKPQRTLKPTLSGKVFTHEEGNHAFMVTRWPVNAARILVCSSCGMTLSRNVEELEDVWPLIDQHLGHPITEPQTPPPPPHDCDTCGFGELDEYSEPCISCTNCGGNTDNWQETE